MRIRRSLGISARILRQFRHDRRTLALLFVAPIVILGLLALLLRGAGELPTAGIVNLDSGPLGARVASALEAQPTIHAQPMSLDAAEKGIRDATIAGYVLLPADMTVQALQRGRLSLELHLEGSLPQPSATLANALQKALMSVAAEVAGSRTLLPAIRTYYLHGGPDLDTLDYFGAGFIGLAVFFLVFVVTSVSFLRERSQGTLERLMATPLRRGELVTGYMAGFSAVALVQAVEVLVFALAVLRLHNSGSVALILGLVVLMAVTAVNLGIFLSMFARTEFQAVQFIPLVIVPQMLLSGIVFPVQTEPRFLQALSDVLPLTYAVDALRAVMIKGADLGSTEVLVDVGVVVGFCLALVIAASFTLRRRLA